jgi:hypothetical protein
MIAMEALAAILAAAALAALFGGVRDRRPRRLAQHPSCALPEPRAS